MEIFHQIFSISALREYISDFLIFQSGTSSDQKFNKIFGKSSYECKNVEKIPVEAFTLSSILLLLLLNFIFISTFTGHIFAALTKNS